MRVTTAHKQTTNPINSLFTAPSPNPGRLINIREQKNHFLGVGGWVWVVGVARIIREEESGQQMGTLIDESAWVTQTDILVP